MQGPTHRTKCFFKNLIFWFSQHLLWPQACSNVGHKVFSSLQGSVDALFHSHSFHLGTNLLSLAQQPNRSKGKEQFSIWWYLRIAWKVKKKSWCLGCIRLIPFESLEAGARCYYFWISPGGCGPQAEALWGAGPSFFCFWPSWFVLHQVSFLNFPKLQNDFSPHNKFNVFPKWEWPPWRKKKF